MTNLDTSVSIPAASTSSTYEYYEEETFDSEFDSDEEFGKRKKKKSRLQKVKVLCVRHGALKLDFIICPRKILNKKRKYYYSK